jgi:hypothetical protein
LADEKENMTTKDIYFSCIELADVIWNAMPEEEQDAVNDRMMKAPIVAAVRERDEWKDRAERQLAAYEFACKELDTLRDELKKVTSEMVAYRTATEKLGPACLDAERRAVKAERERDEARRFRDGLIPDRDVLCRKMQDALIRAEKAERELSDTKRVLVLDDRPYPSRWVPIVATSPSGKRLFVCGCCGRTSTTPDKKCPLWWDGASVRDPGKAVSCAQWEAEVNGEVTRLRAVQDAMDKVMGDFPIVNGCHNCGRYDTCPYDDDYVGRGDRTSCVEYWVATKRPESEHDICDECGGARGRWPACTCKKGAK